MDRFDPYEMNNQSQVDINNFKIIKKIANGGFSFVYLIQNKENEKYYAAKVTLNNDRDLKRRQMIDHEINIMKNIQHPAIIKFIGFSLIDFHGDNNITIIMHLAKNGSLANAIQKSQNSLADHQYDNTSRQIILAGVTCGMMYLHDRKIIHHDLKPENILLDENYHPFITDFGLSKVETESMVNNSNPSGTPIYMAPEIICNDKYDQKIDVYSFGIIMYEVVTELSPYPKLENKEMTELQFAKEVVNHNYRPIFNVPVKKSIKELIERCWSKDSQQRPTFKEIFKKLTSNENYFLDDIDINQYKTYIEFITQNRYSVYKKGENMEEKYTIEKFNELCLKDQQSEISRLIEKSQKDKMTIGLSKINDILLYLLRLNESIENLNAFKIKSIDNNHYFSEIFNDDQDLDQIYLLSNATEKLFINNSLNSDDFIQILNEFDETSFEIEFPSKSFNQIYDKLKEIKVSRKARIKISILITKMNENDANYFQNDANIESVVLNSSVKTVLKQAFINCTSMTEISIPSSVEIIENLAFRGCSQLTKLTIPSSVTSIGSNAFEGCISLETVSIPSSITMISSSCFCRCSSLVDISIPSSVTRIGRNAFRECSSLRQISIPSSVTVIGDNAFAGCSKLLEISLPNTMLSLGIHLFRRCISLMQIVIPSLIPSIRRYSFNECLSLKQISIPSSVIVIEDFAFDGCSSLDQILIPSSVVEIGRSAFSRCSSLVHVSIPSSVKLIGDNAFWGCLLLKQVVIPSSVNKIGHFAFSGCSSLIEISIPSSVQSIGVSAFFDCSLLERISIPSSIKTIDSSTFSECLSLKEIEIPSSVTEINECAFYGCASLTKIVIPASVTTIGNYAFLECNSLKEISIPSSLTNIGEDAFPKGSIITS